MATKKDPKKAAEADAVTTAADSRFKVKRHVTVPQLKIKDGMPLHLRIVEPFKRDEQEHAEWQKAKDAATEAGETFSRMEPPYTCRVENLDDGDSLNEIVAPTVMRSELESAYPDGGYVNRAFFILQKKIEGKRYKGVEIAELDV